MCFYMARRLLKPNPNNASIHELKEPARVGSSETSLRCTAIQMLIVGVTRQHVCQAVLVTERALRKWINAFNERGVDALALVCPPQNKKALKRTQLWCPLKAFSSLPFD